MLLSILLLGIGFYYYYTQSQLRIYKTIRALLEVSKMYEFVYKEREFHYGDHLETGNISYYGYIPPWIPECDDVYLDLGSNIGVMVRKLFEPERYPKSKAKELYDTTFNHMKRTGSKSGLCALGFEPNSKHQKRLREIETNYSRKGWRVHFFPFAISDRDETISFYTEDNSIDKDGGAGLYRRHEKMQTKHIVQSIRLSTFIATILKGKQIKLAKMDLEGSEYKVLVDLLEHGLLCQNYIHTIFIEFHDKFIHNLGIKDCPSLDLLKQINAQACQVTRIIELDDETYLHDDISSCPLRRSNWKLNTLCLIFCVLRGIN